MSTQTKLQKVTFKGLHQINYVGANTHTDIAMTVSGKDVHGTLHECLTIQYVTYTQWISATGKR
jgi:hypothetical protein